MIYIEYHLLIATHIACIQQPKLSQDALQFQGRNESVTVLRPWRSGKCYRLVFGMSVDIIKLQNLIVMLCPPALSLPFIENLLIESDLFKWSFAFGCCIRFYAMSLSLDKGDLGVSEPSSSASSNESFSRFEHAMHISMFRTDADQTRNSFMW
eukprot:Gb_28176 [translate_table: standard]